MRIPTARQTQGWLLAQADLFKRQSKPQRFGDRIAELLRSGSVGVPAWRGGRRFFSRRTPDQEHAVYYVAENDENTENDGAGGTGGTGGTERVLIDPMAIDPSGLTTLDAVQPDKEGRLLAYQISVGGNEESVLYVMDVATGARVEGPIDRCRYSPIAWLPGGEAFYYVRRLPSTELPEGESQFHRRVYLHRVGTSTEDDVMIFGEGLKMTNYYGVSVSRDGRWLQISASEGTAPRNDLWVADLTASSPDRPDLQVVQEGVDAQTGLSFGRDGRLYVHTDRDAPRVRICVTDPETPGFDSWRDLIPEDSEAVLSDFAILDDLERPVMLVSWTRHAISEITVHDLATGERIGEVPAPGLGSIGGISERPEGGYEAWFGYTDNTTPPTIQRYDARTGETTLWAASPGVVDVPPVRHVSGRLPVQGRHRRPHAGRSRRSTATGRARPSCTATAVSALSMTPGYSAVGPRLGRGGRRVRHRPPARRRRGGRGVAPGRHARQQAERLRRLPRRGRAPDRDRT